MKTTIRLGWAPFKKYYEYTNVGGGQRFIIQHRI